MIKNREYMQKIKDFKGLKYRKIYPTDIDGFIDFGDNIFIVIELKYNGFVMPYGQSLAIERITDAFQKAGKKAFVIIGEYESDGDIDVAECKVTRIRYRGKWNEVKSGITVKKAIDNILEKHAPKYL